MGHRDVTFSVVARDADTGDIGCAVQSKFLAVGAAVLHARAGVGAVATQALANLTYGPRGLALLEAGASAEAALGVLVAADELPQRRQAGIVDAAGRAAAHTGGGCTGWSGHVVGDGFACQGNILTSEAVIAAMADVMTTRMDLRLPERLIAALTAGQAAGGDARGQQSAGILVVRAGGGYGGGSDRYVDLRVDDHPEPITELGRLLRLHRLHLERPREDELVPLDAVLRIEVAQRLEAIDAMPLDPDDGEALWERLERWAGRENLEERMVRKGSIDRTVLDILRRRGGGRR